MSSTARHHTLLLVLGAVLSVWGIFLFFQSAYFGSFFYNVPTPFWAVWVGQLPIWAFDAIDTVAVAVLVISLVLASKWGSRRMRGARGASPLGWVLALVGLFLIFAFLAALGFNLAGLWTDFQRFFQGI